jgi:hypothetical protein
LRPTIGTSNATERSLLDLDGTVGAAKSRALLASTHDWGRE